MADWESLFSGKPIQDLRGTLAKLRRASTRKLKRVRRWTCWFVRGIIVGAIWAMLYAPQSGAETRQAADKLLRPLALTGASLLAALQEEQRPRNARMAERRALGGAGKSTEEGEATIHTKEMGGAGKRQEGADRSRSRSS